mmetsp:Transcript_17514/g.55422  ORF Transcript_17514/g.55422 Transcript_17514/m.55422 type:complete len:232 (-) Transcript_17514:54-749(-)
MPPARTSSKSSGSTLAAGLPGSGTPARSSAASSAAPKARSACSALGGKCLLSSGGSRSRRPEPRCESTTARSRPCSPLGSCFEARPRTASARRRGSIEVPSPRAAAPTARPRTTAPTAPTSGAPSLQRAAGSSTTRPLALPRAASASTKGDAKATAGQRRTWKAAARASMRQRAAHGSPPAPPAGGSGGSTSSSGCTKGSCSPSACLMGTVRLSQSSTTPSAPTRPCTSPP